MIEEQPLLLEGLNKLSNGERVTFTRYVARILPSDGFKFWVKASLLPDEVEPFELSIAGSYHAAINQEQNEDDTPAITSVLFTTSYEIAEMQSVDSQTIWIGEYYGSRFSFTRRGKYYAQAGLYHYFGDAIYPRMESQIIDDLDNLNLDDTIVSNSLPFWLDFETAPVYPSYLVPTNLPPPYIAVDMENTKSLQALYTLDNDGNIDNWAQEQVTATLYGFNNNKAFDFLHEVEMYCQETDNMGITNTPTIQDVKSTQSDFNLIAQKKTIKFTVNYHQQRLNAVARRILEKAIITITPIWDSIAYDQIIDYADPLDIILFDDLTSSVVVVDPTT